MPACAPGEMTDPFASAVMEKLGIDMSKHKPVLLAGVRLDRHARAGSLLQGDRDRERHRHRC